MKSRHDDPKNQRNHKREGVGEIDITKCIRELNINNNINILITILNNLST